MASLPPAAVASAVNAALSRALPWADLSLAWYAVQRPARLGVGAVVAASDVVAVVSVGLRRWWRGRPRVVVPTSVGASVGARSWSRWRGSSAGPWLGPPRWPVGGLVRQGRQVPGRGEGEAAGGQGDDEAGGGDRPTAASSGEGHVTPGAGVGVEPSGVEGRDRGVLAVQLVLAARSPQRVQHATDRVVGLDRGIEDAVGVAAGRGGGCSSRYPQRRAARSVTGCGRSFSIQSSRPAVARVPAVHGGWRCVPPPAACPRIRAAAGASKPSTVRSMIASAWSTGRPATSASAASVPSVRPPSARTSTSAGRSSRSSSSTSARGWRWLPTQVVQRPVAPDGGEPATEAVAAAGEPVEVAERLRPRLARHVLGVVGTDEHREVAEQRRVDLPVDRPQGVVVAGQHPRHG